MREQPLALAAEHHRVDVPGRGQVQHRAGSGRPGKAADGRACSGAARAVKGDARQRQPDRRVTEPSRHANSLATRRRHGARRTRSVNLLHLFDHDQSVEAFDSGACVFREGDAGDRMYVILEGEVIISVEGEALFTAKAGDIMGEMALIDDAPRSATATALGPVRLVPVDRRRFMFMVQQTPFFSLHVMKVLADRLRRMDRRVLPPRVRVDAG
ncbi:MAG: cyclic nucleotide-binding domain-containing protein [Planctomycetes bacterium]|nr:cyclic nucleotide-binding domain-containing protein [Planctomycetota bacterium]